MSTLRNVQTIGLQQKLSPHLIQSQLLLAVPTLALEHEIKMQIESNPMLEDIAELEQEEVVDAEVPAANTVEEPPLPDQTDNDNDTYNIDDWYTYQELDSEGYKSPEAFDRVSREEYDARTEYLINRSVRLKETPLEQLHRAGLDEKLTIIGEEILGSLDDDGYLRDPLEEIASDLKKQYSIDVNISDIEEVIKIINKFDPLGLASRNLQECLSVQIEELELDEETKELCLKLVNEHFDELTAKHFEKLSRILKIPLEKVNELFEIIQKLNPYPGITDPDPARDYIYPDFFVTKVDDELQIELTDESLPPVRISKRYLELLRSKKTPQQTREFLKNKLESAKWFINSIISRKQTMMKVMKAIADRQREFFLSNGENLKPLYEKDVASDINMDLSTVSRTVRNKYVQTDFGTFELRYFFSHPIQTDSGEDVSSKLVKEKIREIIDAEDKLKPLSDDKLTEQVNNSGFPLARRTVAKYREAMKIPKASLRRKILVKT